MEAVLIDRDYVPDGRGGIALAENEEALLCRALFCLCCRRGSFPFLPELGSRLWQLKGRSREQITSLAAAYAAEAVEPLGLIVQGVTLLHDGADTLRLDIQLQRAGQIRHVEVVL